MYKLVCLMVQKWINANDQRNGWVQDRLGKIISDKITRNYCASINL